MWAIVMALVVFATSLVALHDLLGLLSRFRAFRHRAILVAVCVETGRVAVLVALHDRFRRFAFFLKPVKVPVSLSMMVLVPMAMMAVMVVPFVFISLRRAETHAFLVQLVLSKLAEGMHVWASIEALEISALLVA